MFFFLRSKNGFLLSVMASTAALYKTFLIGFFFFYSLLIYFISGDTSDLFRVRDPGVNDTGTLLYQVDWEIQKIP